MCGQAQGLVGKAVPLESIVYEINFKQANRPEGNNMKEQLEKSIEMLADKACKCTSSESVEFAKATLNLVTALNALRWQKA